MATYYPLHFEGKPVTESPDSAWYFSVKLSSDKVRLVRTFESPDTRKRDDDGGASVTFPIDVKRADGIHGWTLKTRIKVVSPDAKSSKRKGARNLNGWETLKINPPTGKTATWNLTQAESDMLGDKPQFSVFLRYGDMSEWKLPETGAGQIESDTIRSYREYGTQNLEALAVRFSAVAIVTEKEFGVGQVDTESALDGSKPESPVKPESKPTPPASVAANVKPSNGVKPEVAPVK